MPAPKTIYVNTLPLGSLLGVAFVVLKLTGRIGWSWWWVTCPFWGPLAIFLTCFAGALLVAFLALGWESIAYRGSK